MRLDWEGLVNGRDLAGLHTADGAEIGSGRLVRSASPHSLTPTGWQQLHDHGVRTVVNLMNDAETADRAVRHPRAVSADVTVVRVQLEPDGYTQEWAERDERWKLGTPHYYDDFVTRYPHRLAAALTAIAEAPEGGVLVHCGAGRDRCGLTVAMTLDLVGVDRDAIAADHWLSYGGTDPETQHGKEGILAGRELDPDDHAAALHQLLANSPAESCFPTDAAATTVRSALLRRMIGGG